MPDGSFKLDIVTPAKALERDQPVVSVIVPAAEGYLGILPGHAPLIAELVPGEIRVTRATGAEETMATSGGFVEVTPERVTILADTAERPDEIDVERAREALARAQERLASPPLGTDIDRARAALARATARLRVAGQIR